jgi:diguanylate cyclase (GGDEF)-like protein
VPELRRLTRSMNSLVQRLQSLFDGQAVQLDELRRAAHVDAVTGLANRRHFVGQLNAALQSESRRGAGLLIVRLLELDAMNRRLGHDGTNRLLAAVAEVLQSYPAHVGGALAGRLNGSDMALFLPATGLAGETARSLCHALRAALATVDQGAELVVGGIDALQASDSAAALAAADQALAQAESQGAFAVQVDASDRGGPAPLGERVWHTRIADALQAGRSRLAEYPMLDANGVLLHLECPLRLQLERDGPLEPAARWLPMAVRGRLSAQVDLRALTLALAAIEADGVPRCVNMSAASLSSAGFVEAVARRLEAAPTPASRLWVDLAEVAARGNTARIQRASARWRRLGVKLGLEHAGGALRELAHLQEQGRDSVEIVAADVQGVAREAAVRDFARGLVNLLRGMQLLVLAEGVDDADDLVALWELGFDGATGPALQRAAG